jgi:uncharacterized protein
MPKDRALIEIRLAGLSQGVHEFEFTCSAADFNDPALIEAGFTKEISVKAVVEKSDRELVVSMTTEAFADLACDICLAPVTLDLKGTYRVYYVYDEGTHESQEERNEEYHLIDKSAISIDLTEDARETLLLSIPMKVTCIDNPDCHVHRQENEEPTDGSIDSGDNWQESLERLKNKYR